MTEEKNLLHTKRYWALLGLIVGVLLIGFLVFDAMKYQSTDDAYVETTTVSVSPKVAGQIVKVLVEDNQEVKAGDVVAYSHAIENVTKPEFVCDREYEVIWRGPDVVDILPHGEHMRLFQRNLDIPFVEPSPEEVAFTGAENYGPTQQKR